MLKNKYILRLLEVTVLAILLMAFSLTATAEMKRVKQKLVAPPNLPKHSQIATGKPVLVEINMGIEEKNWVIDADGTQISGMTFNGTNPGPIIVVHQNDEIQLTLTNPKSSLMEHNIDLHAVTGALGGAGLTHVKPGESKTIRFKLTKAGVFVYHCAPGGAMIPYHVVQGMSGAIMVLPRDGLKDAKGKQIKYDRAYYIGEQEFYIPKDSKGNYKKYDNALDALADTTEVMRGLLPTHIGFGGKQFAYTGDAALKANVGETVLLIHSQANNISSPHLIGGHGDYVWERGNFQDPPTTGLETWLIAAGSAGAATYKFKQPGLYVYLNHNLIKAIMFGAAAHLKVEGKWDDNLLKQVKN
ncbi:MAG: nitrite reductase, copper-containing [Gammaproteobacteria bacterium]|nr:nitrite reductase, copper-containing [Gammaproteobacteria bacterium]